MLTPYLCWIALGSVQQTPHINLPRCSSSGRLAQGAGEIEAGAQRDKFPG